MESAEEARCSGSTMDAAQEARCKEMLDEILGMLKKMVSDSEERNAALRAAYPAFVVDNVCVSSSTTSATAPSAAQDISLVVPSANTTNSDDDCEHGVAIPTISNLLTPPSASPTSSPTSAPSKDAALDFQFGVSKLLATSPTRCSTLAPCQATCIPVSGYKSSLSSLTPVPLLDVPIANPTVITEPIQKEHTRCSTLGLYQYACAPVIAITSSALVPASLATAPDQDTKLNIAVAAAEHLSVQHIGFLMSVRSLGATGQKSMLTLSIASTSTTATSVFHCISISHVLSIGKDQLCLNTKTGNTHELFKVTAHASYTSSCDYCKSVELCHHCIDMGNNLLNISRTNHRPSSKAPKPPWLLCIAVLSSWFEKMQLVSGFLLEVSPWYLSTIYLSVRSAAQQRVQCYGAWLEMGKTCIRLTLVISVHVHTAAIFRTWLEWWCHSECISLIQSNCWREVQWDHCQLFVKGNITDEHSVYMMHGWKPPWVFYVCRNISGHHHASSFVMVFLGINIAEVNWKCMVYISGAVILYFWRPVVLFQSCRAAILFGFEACYKWSLGPENFSLQIISLWSLTDKGDKTVRWLWASGWSVPMLLYAGHLRHGQVATNYFQGLSRSHEPLNFLVDSFTSDANAILVLEPHFAMVFSVCKQWKLSWLLGTKVSSSWLGNMKFISGFLLEALPWCKPKLVFVQCRTPWPPPMWMFSSRDRTTKGTARRLVYPLVSMCCLMKEHRYEAAFLEQTSYTFMVHSVTHMRSRLLMIALSNLWIQFQLWLPSPAILFCSFFFIRDYCDHCQAETIVYLWNLMPLNVLDKCTIHSSSLHWFHFQFWLAPYAALGNKIHQNLLAEGTKSKLVFQLDVPLPKLQTITKYQCGLLMNNDDWPGILVPWDPSSVWVWDPGDLKHIYLLFLKQLGGKPYFKEGRMSGYCIMGQTKDKWAGLILYRPTAASHEREASYKDRRGSREGGVEEQTTNPAASSRSRRASARG